MTSPSNILPALGTEYYDQFMWIARKVSGNRDKKLTLLQVIDSMYGTGKDVKKFNSNTKHNPNRYADMLDILQGTDVMEKGFVDFMCGSGLDAAYIAEKLGVSLQKVHLVDIEDLRDPSVADVSFGSVKTSYNTAEYGKRNMLYSSMALHHLFDYKLTLTPILAQMSSPNATIIIRDHDVRSLRDKVCVEFEHFCYEVKEGKYTSSQYHDYDSMCKYESAEKYSKFFISQGFNLIYSRTKKDGTWAFFSVFSRAPQTYFGFETHDDFSASDVEIEVTSPSQQKQKDQESKKEKIEFTKFEKEKKKDKITHQKKQNLQNMCNKQTENYNTTQTSSTISYQNPDVAGSSDDSNIKVLNNNFKGKIQNNQPINPVTNIGGNPPLNGPPANGNGGPGGNPPINPIVGNINPPIVPTIFLSQWARDYVITIPKKKHVIDHFNEEGVQVHVDQKKLGCGHPISAAYREMALMGFIRRVGKNVNSIRILDYYGSMRNKNYPAQNAGCSIEWNCAPDIPVQGDMARGFFRDPILNNNQVFLLQDVYQHGRDSRNMITPEVIIALCDLVSSGEGYGIMREFEGYAGSDSTRYNEGLWYREEHTGMVVFSPDTFSQPYSPHPSPDWMFKHRSINGLDVADIAHYGPYTLFCFRRSAPNAILLQSPALPQPMVDYVNVNKLNWLGDVLANIPHSYTYLTPFMNENKLLVYKPTFNDKNIIFSIKTLTGSLHDSVRTSVINDFRNQPFLMQLQARFNNFYSNLLYNTCEAVLMSTREDQTFRLSSQMRTYSNSEQRLMAVRSNKVNLNDYSYWTVFKNCATALFGLFLLSKAYKAIKFLLMVRSFKIKQIKITMPTVSFSYDLIDAFDDISMSALNIGTHIFSLCSTIKNTVMFFPRLINKGIERTVVSSIENLMPILPPEFAVHINSEQMTTALITQYKWVVWFSPGFEEFLRIAPPVSFLFNHVYETYSKYQTVGLGHAIVNFIFHSVMMSLAEFGVPWWFRTLLHTAFNAFGVCYPMESRALWQLPIPAHTICEHNIHDDVVRLLFGGNITFGLLSWYYAMFPDALYDQLLLARKEYLEVELSPGAYSLPSMACYPATTTPDFEYNLLHEVQLSLDVKWCGEHTDVDTFIELAKEYSLHSYKENKFVYPIMSPINLMHRPSTSPLNLICALFKRSFNDPYINTNFCQATNDKSWDELLEERVPLYDTHYQESYTFEEAIATMDSIKKRRLIKSKLEDELMGAQPRYRKSVSVKHDELIAVKWKDGVPTFKPRAIVQFSPDYIKDGTQFSHTVTDVLHEMYNERKVYYVENFVGDVIPITYVFASGYTSKQLNILMKEMLNDPTRVFYVVAGDDAFVFWGPIAKYYGKFGEQDFGMYDHTQKDKPMEGDEKKFKSMNVPQVDIDRKKFGCESKYNVRAKYVDITISLSADAGTQQPSGDPLTTYINSDHNIDTGHGLTKHSGTGLSIEAVSLKYGFIMKHRQFDFPWQGTFLKGWWISLKNGDPFWLPLPSMVLKIGKVLKDPCYIAKQKDVNTAYRMCLYALARSPGIIPYEYPILGPFVKKMLSLGIESSLRIHHRFKRCEVEYTDQQLDLDEAFCALYYRYGIDKNEVESFTKIVESINTFPCCVKPLSDGQINGRLSVRGPLIIVICFAMSQPQTRPRRRNPPKKKQVPNGINRKIKHTRRLTAANRQNGNRIQFPSSARYVGYGDYTEEKGRALYDKRKLKKRSKPKDKKHDWWETAEKAASLLGKFAPTLLGLGDYEVATNSVSAAATDGKIGGQVPLMENTHCANIIHHREYVGPVMGSTADFTLTQYPLNPGMAETFVWLAPIAGNYTRYRWRGAVAEYVPLASEYAATGLLGYVAMATQYNPLDLPFTSKRTLLNHEFSTESKISDGAIHPFECAKNQMSINEYCIRDAPPPPNADIRFYDLGMFSVATGNNPAAAQIGDLWITYEIEFYQPKVPSSNDTCFMEHRTFAGNPSDGRTAFGSISVSNNGSTLGAVSHGGAGFTFDPTISSGLFLVSWVNLGVEPTPTFNAVGAPLIGTGCVLVADYGIAPNNAALVVQRTNQMLLLEVQSRGAFFMAAEFGYPAGDCRILIIQLPAHSVLPTLSTFGPEVFASAAAPEMDDQESSETDTEEEIDALKDRLLALTTKSKRQKK